MVDMAATVPALLLMTLVAVCDPGTVRQLAPPSVEWRIVVSAVKMPASLTRRNPLVNVPEFTRHEFPPSVDA